MAMYEINRDTSEKGPAHPLDIVSLSCGIVSFVLSLIPVISSLIGAVGIITGVVANQRCDSSYSQRSSHAKTGIICSVVGIILNILFSIILLIITFIFASSLLDILTGFFH